MAKQNDLPPSSTVSGVVLDASGKPEANTVVAQRWVCENGVLSPDGPSMRTDENGRFSGNVSTFRFPIALMAVDAKGRLGQSMLLSKADLSSSLSFRLAPLEPVRMRVEVKQLPGYVETQEMEIYAQSPNPTNAKNPDQAFFLGFDNAKAPLRLPPGTYRLLVRTRTISYFQHAFTLPDQASGLDLGALEADASTEGMLFGHPIPEWHLLDSRGCLPTVKVSDFRGKWLLVEAWAYWCVPCVQEGIPALMKFSDEHKAYADRYSALAFHTYNSLERAKVASLADVDKLTASTKAKYWGGRDIPVPILLDQNDETAKLREIGAIPNVMLIDPNGVLVRTNDPYGYLDHELKSSVKK